jgi:wobble nucleotide-excising tRNase
MSQGFMRESTPMIKKLQRIDNFRIFQDWVAESGSIDFARVNLVYGVNGSGKSTLATLLAEAGSDIGWRSGLRLTVADDNGDVSTVATADAAIWKNLRVFNSAYVALNLHFDTDGQSSTQPLLILGEANIDKTKQINSAEARLQQIAVDLPARREIKRSASQRADALATQTATLVVEELSPLGGRYAPRSYNARQVKDLLRGPAAQSKTDVTEDLENVRSRVMNELALHGRAQYGTATLEAASRTLLAKSALSVPIAELRDDAALAAWVQRGLGLHEDRDVCAFCGGAVSSVRIEDLERHFDESLRALQSECGDLSARLGRAIEDLNAAIESLPKVDQLAVSLRADWKATVDEVAATAQAVGRRLEALRKLVEQKQSNLFTAQPLPELPGEGELSLAAVTDLLDRHNELCARQETLRQEAARAVELNRVEACRADYEALLEQAEDATELITKLVEEERALRQQLRELAQQDLDATPLATSLNHDLARLLGRDDLVFSLAEEGYTIQRDGKPALYLSEGEKTAISLLHFLKSLDAHDCDRENTIVVIDDPVSSLDSNVVAGVSAHLWARLVGGVKCRQLFLLTHSFELFRSWSNLLDRLPDEVRSSQNITDTTQELRVRIIKRANGGVQRWPYLMSWPTSRRERSRIRSEYHYLFWRAAQTLEDCQSAPTPEKELDAAAILPNVCRRLLEGFLSFKYPEKIGDFRALVEAAIGATDNSVTRTRIVAYLHQYSHNEEGDISRPVARPESINILSAVFELIRIVDGDHYEKMCSTLRVSPQLLDLA